MSSHSLTSHPKLIGSKGPLKLVGEIARGGEGAIYGIADSDCLAKVYLKPLAALKSQKITAMIGMRSLPSLAPVLAVTAWPIELLKDANGDACGFTMRRISGHKDVHKLYRPVSRKIDFPNADWRFLIRTSLNIAKAFAELHSSSCVIGDVNQGGVIVSDKATVYLIDCDSFQVTAGGKTFLCEMGTDFFTPPELRRVHNFSSVTRTFHHDNFGLAILVFQLLMMGRHPFAGRYLGTGDMPIEKAIEEFRFAYSPQSATFQMEPPPAAPSIGWLAPGVARLMERAFSREGSTLGRPSAKEWVVVLSEQEKHTRQCGATSNHFYFDGLNFCPWCRLENATGTLLFAVKITAQVGQDYTSQVAVLWQRITSVQSPGLAPALLDRQTVGIIKPDDDAIATSKAKRFRSAASVIVFLLGIALCFVVPAAWVLWIGGGIAAAAALANDEGLREKQRRFESEHRDSESQYKRLKEQWDRDASELTFTQKLQELEKLKKQLMDLPNVRQQRLQALERDRQRQQLDYFLEKFLIEDAVIPGIGANRKAMLQSYNIETARDVKRFMSVPGFGPALKEKLMDWRRGLEQKFKFDPQKGIDPRDLISLEKELADQRMRLERGLASGPQELMRIRATVLAQRKVLEAHVNSAFSLMLKHEANVTAARGRT